VNIPWRLVRQCLLSSVLVGWTVQPARAGRAMQNAAPAAATLEDFERRIGPLVLKGQSFTVILHGKRVRATRPIDPDSQQTVVGLEIRDAGGNVHYQRSFAYEVAGGAFAETLDVTAQVLEGSQGAGLLLTYGELPSAPLGGQSWQVFGLFDRKLVPFSKRIFADGNLVNSGPDARVVRASREPNFQPDVVHVRVWVGNFFVIVPLRVDWLLAKMRPAWICSKLTRNGPKPLCEYQVESDRHPSEEDLTFVRLFAEADEGFGTPAHVVVKKDSRVEILATEAQVDWEEDTDAVKINIAGDPWLKVRIDGKEGWIHTQEDFEAIGLPQTG
jgi:hypothetical protein